MNRFYDNEYQHPLSPGSLAGAQRVWQTLVATNAEPTPQGVTFTLLCPSRSRAVRVAGFLRRRLDCTTATARGTHAGYPTEWRVDGTTREEVQSLRRLEHLFTWLRRAARSHQVRLLDPVVGPAA